MEQVHFCGKVRIIRKSAERIYSRMNRYTGDKTSAPVKNCNQQKTHRNRKNDLEKIVYKIYTAAVEQVDNMPDTEGDAGDDNGGSDIILCDSLKQKSAEDYLLQKSDTKHACNPTDRFTR